MWLGKCLAREKTNVSVNKKFRKGWYNAGKKRHWPDVNVYWAWGKGASAGRAC